ncbi:hypothetical protein GCM10027162_14250 [Streptomyces incanus]
MLWAAGAGWMGSRPPTRVRGAVKARHAAVRGPAGAHRPVDPRETADNSGMRVIPADRRGRTERGEHASGRRARGTHKQGRVSVDGESRCPRVAAVPERSRPVRARPARAGSVPTEPGDPGRQGSGSPSGFVRTPLRARARHPTRGSRRGPG